MLTLINDPYMYTTMYMYVYVHVLVVTVTFLFLCNPDGEGCSGPGLEYTEISQLHMHNTIVFSIVTVKH